MRPSTLTDKFHNIVRSGLVDAFLPLTPTLSPRERENHRPPLIGRALSCLAVLPLVFVASGCVYALHMSSEPTDVKLKIEASQPEQHKVRVALEQPVDYPVAPDGRVEFTVPRFSNGCDVYVFGVVKARDGSAEGVRVVEVRRAGRVLRKLSVSEIAKLPTDAAGYRIVRI